MRNERDSVIRHPAKLHRRRLLADKLISLFTKNVNLTITVVVVAVDSPSLSLARALILVVLK